MAEAFHEHPHLLVNGTAVYVVVGAAGRAVGPAVTGYFYSLFTQYGNWSFGTQISWIVFLALTIPPFIFARFVPMGEKGKAEEAEPLLPGLEGAGDDVV